MLALMCIRKNAGLHRQYRYIYVYIDTDTDKDIHMHNHLQVHMHMHTDMKIPVCLHTYKHFYLQ